MLEILDDIERWRSQGQQVALATVIKTVGSTPRPLGSKMAVSEQGSIAGSVSGGCIEGAVFEEAQATLRDGAPRRVRFGISDQQAWEVGLSCGGTVEVLVEKLPDPTGGGRAP